MTDTIDLFGDGPLLESGCAAGMLAVGLAVMCGGKR